MSTPIAHAERLQGVHPDLVKVIEKGAAECLVPIMIVQGTRSQVEAFTNFGKGRNRAECLAGGCPADFAQPGLAKVTWVRHALSSKHIVQPDGYGHAVDVSPVPYEPQVGPHYFTIASSMKNAARELGIGVAWGGDWTTTKDYPHFELV